jgi:hypothetical protein
MKFATTLELHGKTATGIEVPGEVVEALGAGNRPPVTVQINTFTYRSTIARMGGVFLLPVSAEVRAGAGISAGERIDVEVELDTAPREVVVPDDFRAALEAAPGATTAFDKLSFTHRKEHVRAIEEAKTDATRQRRIAKAVEKLTAG